MQTLFKFRAVPRSFVRSFSMGKPESVESWDMVNIEEKKIAPVQEKFTNSFQAYLDSRLTYEEMMNQSDAEKKKSLKSYIQEGDLFTSQKECPDQSQVSEAKS